MAQRLVSTTPTASYEASTSAVQSSASASWDPGTDYRFGLFVVNYRKPDIHPLRPCVYLDVLHAHFSFRWRVLDKVEDSWSKLHVGTYTETSPVQRCYVVFDSEHTNICVNFCYASQKLPPRGEVVSTLAQKIRYAIQSANHSVSNNVAMTVALVLGTVAVFAL